MPDGMGNTKVARKGYGKVEGKGHGRGTGKGNTQFFGQCYHCGDRGTPRTIDPTARAHREVSTWERGEARMGTPPRERKRLPDPTAKDWRAWGPAPTSGCGPSHTWKSSVRAITPRCLPPRPTAFPSGTDAGP